MINGKQTPTAQVLGMRKQGLTDNQIIQSLQQQGFSSQEVLDALEYADHTPPAVSLQTQVPPMANPMQHNPPPLFEQKPLEMPRPNQVPVMPQPAAQPPKKDEEIEELIEAIIEEKWADVEKDMDRLLDWKNTVDERITTIQTQMGTLKQNFEDLHKAIIGKIGDYDKNILQVGTQLKAMEQVFSKVLPTFTDNVAELSRITDKVRKL